MRIRYAVFAFYLILFFLGLVAFLIMVASLWNMLSKWKIALFGLIIITNLCAVLIAYWVNEDEERINYLVNRIFELERQIGKTEKKDAYAILRKNDQSKEPSLCETCAFFGKNACRWKEKNPKEEACAYYRKRVKSRNS